MFGLRPPIKAPNRRTVAMIAAAILVAAGFARLEPSGSGGEESARAVTAATSGVPFGLPATLKKGPAPHEQYAAATPAAQVRRTAATSPDLPPHHAEAANLVPAPSEMGEASWYDLHGDTTANGENLNSEGLTAAHATLPLGTRALVENLKNGQIVVVRINDRLPPDSNRLIDVSKGAAEQLDMIADGIATVRVRQVESSLAHAPGAPGPGTPIDYH